MERQVVGDSLPRRGNRISKAISDMILALMGWRVETDSLPDEPKMILVGAPHTSNWDFIMTLLAIFSLEVRVSWLAKHTLFRKPIGGLMRWLGGVPVDRRSSGGLVGQMVDQFNFQEKLLLAIMPEGTRSKTKSWKTGFYHIARQADVPISAVIFDYERKILTVGPGIPTKGDETADLERIQAVFKDVKGRHTVKQLTSERAV